MYLYVHMQVASYPVSILLLHWRKETPCESQGMKLAYIIILTTCKNNCHK